MSGKKRRPSDDISTPAVQARASATPGKRSRSSALPVQMRSQSGDLDGAEAQETAARGVAGSGAALPHGAVIQKAFGKHDVSNVKAHVGGEAASASEALGARAFATGSDVAFADSPDLHTAAHEAAHVIQQQGGVQLAGGVGREGDAYEQHADRVADLVVGGYSAESALDEMVTGFAAGPSVQMKGKDDKEIVGRITKVQSSKGGTKVTFNKGSDAGIEPGWSVKLSDGTMHEIVESTPAYSVAMVDLSMDAVRALDRSGTFIAEKKSRKEKKLEKKATTVKIRDVKGTGDNSSKVEINKGMDDGFNVYWKVEYLNDDGSPRVDGTVLKVEDGRSWLEFPLSYQVIINSSRMVRLIPYN